MTNFSFYEYKLAFRSAVILAGLGDLYDEHWLHVKYHIIAMTAVAYAHASITSPASDGEICMCVLNCYETAHWVLFLCKQCQCAKCLRIHVHILCVRVCVCSAAGVSVFHFVFWG